MPTLQEAQRVDGLRRCATVAEDLALMLRDLDALGEASTARGLSLALAGMVIVLERRAGVARLSEQTDRLPAGGPAMTALWITAPAPSSWIFTFGSGHVDRNGQSLGHRFVRIPGTALESRMAMLQLRGRAWAFQYATHDEAGVDRHGLIEVSLEEVTLP